MANGKHLTLQDREIISQMLKSGETQTKIAKALNKNKSTISSEIALHSKKFCTDPYPIDCKHFRNCKDKNKQFCSEKCKKFEQFKCKRRDISPKVCNGCEKIRSCRYQKISYDPNNAQKEYEKKLVESRVGINLTEDEVKKIGAIIAPLIKKGQSPYAIVKNHPELEINVRPMYTYIEMGVFREFNLLSIDLRRKVGRKIAKTKNVVLKKRKDNRYILGHTYDDYLAFKENHPDAVLIQMDTVYNDRTEGPFMQTFKIVNAGFMFAFYHEKLDSESMIEGIKKLSDIFGDFVNKKPVVILTDRGTEFSAREKMEINENGELIFNIFYCNPMASNEKGSLENNHEELRYIFPKKENLKDLGLTSQENLNLAISHINSYPKKKLQGKTPL